MTKVTILNTSILTAYGKYSYTPLSLEEAKKLVSGGFKSAIGHQSTADVISTLLGISCPMNRISYQHSLGDKALVFKLNRRPGEGEILTEREIKKIGYSFGLIERIE